MSIVDARSQTVVQLNNTGGSSATDGLKIYIDATTKIQVRRLAGSNGQVYSSTVNPPNASLDNGVFIRVGANTYGPSHTVATFNPIAYASASIGSVSPVTPADGIQQSVTSNDKSF
ncbi:MAG: hypothetical protein K2P84_01995 [Undibacterium sp.]|nr:hypothetical protein [Undibacterium sp.]